MRIKGNRLVKKTSLLRETGGDSGKTKKYKFLE